MREISKMLLVLSTLFLLSPLAVQAESYPSKIVSKLNTGLANVATGFVEIPKTVLLTTNTKGPLYGLTIGFGTGIFHSAARTVLGAADIATFFVPSKPYVQPKYIWKDFDRETRYFDYYAMR